MDEEDIQDAAEEEIAADAAEEIEGDELLSE